jgi:two-component system, OmpR family, sensor kinase
VHGPRGGRIRIALDPEADAVLLSVEDDGPGLSAAEAERAVERFWRGERATARPGSGLGLAIVRATAERHGGALMVSGARFTLRLPARISVAR